jgi:DNA-binding NarL/FixJ family response regulator
MSYTPPKTRRTIVAQAKQIRILSVEDHPVFRQGLATTIETEPDLVLVGQAANAVKAIGEFRRHRPDVTLMDLRLPGTNRTDILITIRGEFPDARIIMLSSSDSDGEIQRALRSGASGYVLKRMAIKDHDFVFTRLLTLILRAQKRLTRR